MSWSKRGANVHLYHVEEMWKRSRRGNHTHSILFRRGWIQLFHDDQGQLSPARISILHAGMREVLKYVKWKRWSPAVFCWLRIITEMKVWAKPILDSVSVYYKLTELLKADAFCMSIMCLGIATTASSLCGLKSLSLASVFYCCHSISEWIATLLTPIYPKISGIILIAIQIAYDSTAIRVH